MSIQTHDFEKLEGMLLKHTDALEKQAKLAAEGATAEAKEAREKAMKIEADVGKTIKELQEKHNEASDRLTALEQKGHVGQGNLENAAPKSIGAEFVESDIWKGARERGNLYDAKVEVGSFWNRPAGAAIVNETGQNQPLVPDMRVPGIIKPAIRRYRVRDLLPVGRTQSNLIQFVKENVFTNAAEPQYSPVGSPSKFENVEKAESSLTFTLDNAAVQTVAHWIPASRQILDDAPMLGDYIDTRLREGLAEEEEDQLLLGDGTGGNLSGLVTEATAFSQSVGVNDTKIDVLRKYILQVALSHYVATGIVLHPSDWAAIELIKVNAGTDDRYIFANPQSRQAPMLWGLPVVDTVAMTNGKALVGAFAMAAQIWDRMNATVEVSREHSDYFIKNMVAILAEERLALTVYRSAAIIYGNSDGS